MNEIIIDLNSIAQGKNIFKRNSAHLGPSRGEDLAGPSRGEDLAGPSRGGFLEGPGLGRDLRRNDL